MALLSSLQGLRWLPGLLLLLSACDRDAERIKDTGEIDSGDTGIPALAPSLGLTHDPLPLTDSAKEAVAAAPTWLRTDLSVALGSLDASFQDTYATLLLTLPDPAILDEVAFDVAHTSPEILTNARFHPQLFVDDALAIQAHDAELDYVRLVEMDEGTPDAWTTAAYRVEVEGKVVERTISRDLYYWYVVHPRLEDEHPYYIDAYAECSARTLECPTTPEDGATWRDFLWTAADDVCPSGVVPCPVLREVLGGQDLLWKSRPMNRDDNGAIGVITQWVLDVLDFGALSERSIQPNRIYGLHHGNCGEHADFTSAAARAALIPTRNVGAWGNDHTWNEFWDESWTQWEPVNTYVEFYWYYVNREGDYYRSLDWLDNDCDGTADEGLDTADHDGDGVSIADGDCDDSDAMVFPGATEEMNGQDDDCDGIADDGSDTSDLDGDGYSIAAGDCDDNDAGRRPDAPDPAISNNRLYAISTARGDAWLDQVTDTYGRPFWAEITVTDRAGLPVDGATVSMYGPITVYPEYSDYWWFVTEATTDLDGVARFTLGEANEYAFRVDSDLGGYPSNPNSIHGLTEWSLPGETLYDEVSVPGNLSALSATETDLVGGREPDVTLSWNLVVESSRIRSQTVMLGDTFSLEQSGGSLDLFVVDEANLALFEAGQPFEAQTLRARVNADEGAIPLPLDTAWTLVLSNTSTLNSVMVGNLDVDALGSSVTWSDAWSGSFQIPPRGWLAFTLKG
jgi:hypothetical protein